MKQQFFFTSSQETPVLGLQIEFGKFMLPCGHKSCFVSHGVARKVGGDYQLIVGHGIIRLETGEGLVA